MTGIIEKFSATEITSYSEDCYRRILLKNGYSMIKIKGRARTNFKISKNNESFNVKILSYRFNADVTGNYAYVTKDSFDINFFDYLIFVLYLQDNKSTEYVPHVLKIPSKALLQSNEAFKNRDYIGLKSKPEYGIEMTKSSIPYLLQYEIN